MFELQSVPRDFEHGGHPTLQGDCHVAQADRPMAGVQECLRDDPDRIGEVDEPGPGRAAVRGLLGQLHDHGDGAERLGEPTGAGGFLADTTEAQRQCLVAQSGFLAAHADLRHDEPRSVQGTIPIRGHHELAAPALASQDPAGDPAHHIQAIGVDVEQRQLVDGETVVVSDDALDELGCVGAAGAGDGDLHPHAEVTSSVTSSS